MKALGENYQDISGKKPSALQNFFILCSGADKDILKECRTEWNKFAGIGATIFLTSCLALLSGAYAMNFVFENGIYSILFGVFWAIVIFNLDRYIVLSLKKEKIPTTTDIKRETEPKKVEELRSERKRLKLNQFYMASPRFIIAIIIALTVSKPLELRLFKNRIDKELEGVVKYEDAKFDAEEAKRVDDLNKQLTAFNKQEQDDKFTVFSNNPIYRDANEKIPKLEADIRSLEQRIAGNIRIIDANRYKETWYTNGRNRITREPIRIVHTEWRLNAIGVAKRNENKNMINERQSLNRELVDQKSRQSEVEKTLSADALAVSKKYESAKQNITQQIEQQNKTYQRRKNAWIDANKKSADLPARLEALGNISQFGNSIWFASLVITLLFIVLETAPVVVKLLTKRGPYDEKLDALEYQIYIEESRKIDSLNREVNEYMKLADGAAKLSGSLRLAAEKDKLDIELNNNKHLLNKLADYQRDLANIYAEAWYQEEKTKAKEQVKEYYQEAIQSKQAQEKAKFDGYFWRKEHSTDKVECYFRNGSITNNELLYIENDKISTGRWSYSAVNGEIEIELLNKKVNYIITEINDVSFKLKDKETNDVLEFQKG